MQPERFAQLCLHHPSGLPMGINVKSDGLHSLVGNFIIRVRSKNYFVFDMPNTDTLGYLNLDTHFYMKISEFELKSAVLNEAKGIWLDCFQGDWYGTEVLSQYL